MNLHTSSVVILLSMLAVAGCTREGTDSSGAAKNTPDESASDAPGVTADAATQRGLGIELAAVASASVEAQARGTATVIDSSAGAESIARS